MKRIVDIHCSGLSRPMTCAGSLFFENLPPSPTNAAAEEGTAAGEYLERLLTGQPITTHAKNGVAFDDEMKFHTQEIAKEILAHAETPVLCEQKIDWMTRSGIVIAGKYDASYVRNGKLYIDDLKYGWLIVDVFENWQLLGYAIGEIIRRGQAFEKIVMRIHQPRPHHEDGPTRTWEISYNELLAYKEQIEVRMEEIAAGQNGFVTSKKCKYCAGVAEACPAFNRMMFAGINVVLNEFQQDSIDDKELSFQLDLLDRVEEVLKIKKDSIKTLAVDRIKSGRLIPGYITEQSYGDRKWKAGVSPQAIEMMTGLKIVEEVMLSPAKAERMGVPKQLVTEMVDRFFMGQKLVRKDSSKEAEKLFNKIGVQNGTN